VCIFTLILQTSISQKDIKHQTLTLLDQYFQENDRSEDDTSEDDMPRKPISPTKDVEECEKEYKHYAKQCQQKASNILLLDEILVPLEESMIDSFSQTYHTWYKQQVSAARQERDHALILARHYRNEAEKIVSQKRIL